MTGNARTNSDAASPGRPGPAKPADESGKQSLARDLSLLLKPTLGASILFTIIPGLLLGPQLPDASLIFFTMLGTYLVAIASFAYNQLLEIPTDGIMERTRNRPLPAGRFQPFAVHLIGSSLLGLGLFLLVMYVNSLAAIAALASFLWYVFIYTAWLKPRSSLNTVLGGAAGSIGPLIGEAAASGQITVEGWMMFLILFLWQPPHFWCLGIKYRDQYARAGLPILPVAKGVGVTLNQMIFYQVLLLLSIFSMYFPLGMAGEVFLIPGFGFGCLVLYYMLRLRADFERTKDDDTAGRIAPLKVFFLTILHMLIWHLALGADIYLRRWA
ncbi:MAG: heme o synthase [bacterium]|nr:heme o synthase [bacterium]